MSGVGVFMRRQLLRKDRRDGICCNPMNQNDVTTPLSHRKIVRVLGFPMDVIGYDEAVERVIGWIKGDRHPRILLTVNSSLLVERERDAEFRAACDNVDMSVPDGVPVVWLSKLLGAPLKERIAGVDLMHTLLQRGNDEKLRVYFLGATDDVIQRLNRLCESRFPDLVVVGSRNGYFSDDEEESVCEAIRDARADLLFIGMPSPRKEHLAEQRQQLMGVPVTIGVGGSFDVITGKVRRAPEFMQKTGFEWLWRLMMEPRKLWKRYLYTNSRFIWMSIKAIVRRTSGSNRPSSKKSGPIL